MLPPINPFNQVVHLYPDGEVRYKISLRHRERDNDTYHSLPPEVIAQLNKKKISKKKLSKSVRPGWGELSKPKKFTVYAKNTIRRIGGAMQLEFGKERLAMLTLTIPGSANEVIEAVARYSGEIMNRIQTYLTDNFQFSNGEKYAVGVVELQKRGMLHWHFLVALEYELLIDSFREKIEAFWFRVLKQLSKKSGVDLFKRKQGDSWEGRYKKIKERAVNVQSVKKNVAAYLAKYMSKGSKYAVNKDKGICYSPSWWWTKSDDAIALMHRWTVCYPLPNVNEDLIEKVIKPEIKGSFEAYGFWQVVIRNRYAKSDVGLIGRGDYSVCKEWCEDFIPILIDISQDCIEENNKYQKEYCRNIFKAWEEKRNGINERRYLSKREHSCREQYFRAINEFNMSSEEAFKLAWSNRIPLPIHEFVNDVLRGMEPVTKIVYDPISNSLIEALEDEYRRLKIDWW